MTLVWTETRTETPIETGTPTPGGGSLFSAASLASVVSYPNPSKDGTANLSYEVSGSSSSAAQALLGGGSNGRGGYDSEVSVILHIYTQSGRLLWTHRVQGAQMGTNVFHWDGHDVKNAPLANGLYLYTVTLEKNGVTQTKTRAIIIMK